MDETAELTQQPEKNIGLETALAHVVKNLTPAKEGRKCVDGRYASEGNDQGMIARPGGDFGYVMALLAVNREKQLGLTPEQCVDAVFNAVTVEGNLFYMHTDTHAEHDHGHNDKPAIGCGHIAKALNPELASGYAVPEDDMRKAFAHMQKYLQLKEKVRMTVLEGDHKEQGVLVVDSETRTVKPQNEQDKTMYFIYDKKRDAEYIQKTLIPRLKIQALNGEDFMKAADAQLAATLHNLALGANIYHVGIQNEIPVVLPLGKVQ